VIRIAPAPGGDGVVAWRFVIQLGPVTIFFDSLLAVKCRAEIGLNFNDVAQPVAADLQDRLMRLAVERVDVCP
jgi:hypothetical protein